MNPCPHCGKDTDDKKIEFHWMHIDGVNQSIEKVDVIPTFKKYGKQYFKNQSEGVPLIYVADRKVTK